jgi:hypothetical protein
MPRALSGSPCNKSWRRGCPAVLQRCAGPCPRTLRSFRKSSGYYDILPVADLAPVAAKLAGTTAEEYVKTSGKLAAEAWMQGIHKSMLQQTSPIDVCKRFASMMRQLYNFGRPELVAISDGAVDAVTSDIPEPIVWWWTTSSIGYLEVVIQAAGGKDGGIRFHEPQLETVRHGIRIMKVPNTTYWG